MGTTDSDKINFSKPTEELCFGQHWDLLGGIWNFLTWGQLLVSSHRNHPCRSPTTKILPYKPNKYMKIQQVPVEKNPPTCTRNNNLNFLCYLAKWLVCLVGRVGGPQALSCAFSRWCPGHRLCKCQSGPGQQQIEVSNGSAAGGSSLVCEGLGVKSFHSVTLSKP